MGLFKLELNVEGKPVNFILDTGAEVTILTEQTAKDIKIRLRVPTRLLIGANAKQLNVLSEACIKIQSKGISIHVLASIVEGAKCNLLGVREIRALGLLVIARAAQHGEFNPVTSFPTLFNGLGKMPGLFKIVLKPGTDPLHLFTPRSIAAGLRDRTKAELEKVLHDGIIEPVKQPTDWCSGLTIAPKADGGIRMCVDLSRLNKGVRREPYSLPKTSELLASLSTGKFFSKLDANSGFW